jgi:hypothetical protein
MVTEIEKDMELGKEYPPVGEAEAIEQIRNFIKDGFERFPYLHTVPVRRFVHAKGHGCVKAYFIVEENIPAELRIGVFRFPAIYEAWIRFSNGSPLVQSDWRPDARGMAIKLMGISANGVQGQPGKETAQDFVMINYPAFFIRNAMDFASFSSHVTGGSLPLSFFFCWNPLKWRMHEFLTLVRTGLKWIPSLLGIQYWSQTPYRLGTKAIKFSARPCSPRNDFSLIFSHDRLRKIMTGQLKCEASFDFLIQEQTSATRMPIEDATSIWPENLSPYRKVATIKIPPQDFNTLERLSLEENLSFAPWHSLPEHHPIGGINRARRAIYELSAELRLRRNDVAADIGWQQTEQL